MKHILSMPLILLFFVTLLNSCKESPNDPALKESKIEFAFSSSQVKSNGEQGLTSIVVSVEDLQGNTILNSEKIDIYHMNGKYISEPVTLVVGEYKLSRFLVLNEANDVVYATPKEGSDKAHLVENPLPIDFSASKDSINEVTPEVVLVADSNPEEFGYVSFSFDIANSFKILMGAAILDSLSQNYKLTNAHVEIYNETTLVYEGELNPSGGDIDSLNYDSLNLVNEIILPEKYNEFTVIVSKWGYEDYNKTFPKEELRLYYREEDKGPLIVTLDEVCYLPEGSANIEAYPVFQLWPDATINVENLSIQDADQYIIDFGDGTVNGISGFEPTFTHTYDSIGLYQVKLTVVKDGCVSESIDSIIIGSIASAYAGEDTITSIDSIAMNAHDPFPETGTWSLISGSGIILDINDPNTTIIELGIGENIFGWTVDYGQAILSDEVSITYNP